ncbi:MAG: hypothetical protein HYY15_02230 [Candidatus Omnitrophica bacterium]|nr:hypothetical protein [Candidatus Omnitrophota bacterium]
MTSRLRGWWVLVILLGTLAYALAEDLTLTTYYPSPRGVYKELRTSGDVAIGTTSSPAARLQVIGDLNNPAVYVVGGGGTTTLRIDDAPSGDTSPFLIDSNGNVAIGTTDPGGYALRVQGNTLRVGTSDTSTLIFLNGQVGIGTTNPTAALDIRSTNSGFLPPRLLPSAVTSPVEGMVIYNTDSNQLEVYDGTSWKSAGGALPHGIQPYDTAGTYTFIAPADVPQIVLEMWGAGGGGGNAVCCWTPGAGGGGGGYGKGIVPVISGASYTVVVGAGGAGGAACGGYGCTGGSSTFSGQGISYNATGGGGGKNGCSTTCSGAGQGGSSTLTLAISGQAGAQGDTPVAGSGGRGGDGGNGGSGGATTAAVGAAPGGGGAGGGPDGGTGAKGKVVISW